MKNKNEHRLPARLRLMLGGLGFAAMLTVCVIAGYFIQRLLPQMPSLAVVLVSLWLGFAVFYSMGWLLHLGRQRLEKHVRHDPWEAILSAMERISRGDFSAIIPETGDKPLSALGKAVNDMAKNLGTLETMRQDFISNVSHEIQSPLTSIGGFATLLRDPDLSPEDRARYAEIIESESRRLSSLSDNLLKLSSLDDNKIPLSKTEFRLDKQLEQVMLTLEPQWSAKNLSLEADLQRCQVTGDEDLLSQVWINILVNAIKFTPEGGKITVQLNLADGRPGVIIADTGCGIAPEDQMHIFERFYKADRARSRALGGNGLGLSLAKRIIELHGGEIAVVSEPERGTTFTVNI